MNAQVRVFDSGASRDVDHDKFDYEAFLSPLAIERFAEYMHKHRRLPDGSLRDGDNWQRGIPLDAYMKSGMRHQFDWWKEHRGIATRDGLEEALCALVFNAFGYLHETLKRERQPKVEFIPDPALDPTSPDAFIEQILPPGTKPGEE